MIKSYIPSNRLIPFLQNQKEQIDQVLNDLDYTWIHAKIVENYCLELKKCIKPLLLNSDSTNKI